MSYFFVVNTTRGTHTHTVFEHRLIIRKPNKLSDGTLISQSEMPRIAVVRPHALPPAHAQNRVVMLRVQLLLLVVPLPRPGPAPAAAAPPSASASASSSSVRSRTPPPPPRRHHAATTPHAALIRRPAAS